MKPLNILIIPSWYPSEMDPNGVPFVRAQARALKRAGHNVTVVFTQAYSLKTVAKQKRMMWKKTDRVVEGVREIHSYRPKTHIRRFDEITRKRMGKRFLKHLINEIGTPDVVHVHTYLAGNLAIWFSSKYNVPLVATEHYTGFARGIVKPWELRRAKKLYQFSKINIAVSELFAKLLQQHIGCNFITLPNMVDTDLFRPDTEERKGPFHYLFVGYLHHKKNTLLLLQAFNEIIKQYPESHLTFIGEGEMESTLKRFVEEHNLNDSVDFPGFLKAHEIAQEMKKASCLVLPSKYETFGIVVIEAMACGIPVIVTPSGGPETFVIPETGIISKEDLNSLIKAMGEIRMQRWECRTIRTYVEENFSEKAVIKRLVDLYNTILN